MADQRYRLTQVRIKRVSLVDNPANEAATVVLYKGDLGGESRGNLSDADFAAVWTDADGNKQRKLPIHDAAHVRNALARWNQTDLPADVKAKARRKLEAAARRLGIGDYGDKEKSMAESESTKAKGKDGDGEPDEDDMHEEMKKLKAQCAKLEKELEASQKELKETKSKLAEREKAKKESDGENVEAAEKSLPPAALEMVKKAQAKADEAEAKAVLVSNKLAAMEDESITKAYVEKALRIKNLSIGKAEEFGLVLKRIGTGKSTEEDAQEIERVLLAASAAAKPLMKAVGSGHSGTGGGTAAQELDAKVAEYIQKSVGDKKPTYEQALTAVAKEEPELWRRHMIESRMPNERAANEEE